MNDLLDFCDKIRLKEIENMNNKPTENCEGKTLHSYFGESHGAQLFRRFLLTKLSETLKTNNEKKTTPEALSLMKETEL